MDVRLVLRPGLFRSYKNLENNIIYFQKRYANFKVTKLSYSEFGDPIKVVHIEEGDLDRLQPNQVLVKMLAAPVNPADINTIQGKYPSKPNLPAVPGNEGVGEIVEIGIKVEDFKVGDRVIPLVELLGTWRTYLMVDSKNVLKIPPKLGLVQASTLTINPCTAYRMLKDFAKLKKGDVVIQNGANSACGQNAIQLAKHWGYKTVNVVRDRPNIGELKQYLEGVGAHVVFTEEELKKTDLFKSKRLAKPKLALNCVGGKNAMEIIRHLDNGATVVTYGGMSLQPLIVPTSALIFKDIKVRGFWVTAWSKKPKKTLQRMFMFNELIELMSQGILQPPTSQMVPFKEYKEALMNTMTSKGMIGKKYILQM